MAIENLQKSEGIASHKSSLLNSHVSQPGTFFEKDMREKCKKKKSVAEPVGSVFFFCSSQLSTLPTASFTLSALSH